MKDRYFFTSESVTEGHPDKICDQISDAILDDILSKDPMGRVAAETMTTTGMVMIMGEITTDCYVDIDKIARKVIREIGYDRAEYGFDANTCAVLTVINEQSADIALGVDNSLEKKSGAVEAEEETGAACNETPELMPLTTSLAHTLARRLTEVRKSGLLPYLRPDGKSQVTIEFENEKPKRIEAVVISSQHSEDIPMEQLRADYLPQLALYREALEGVTGVPVKKAVLYLFGIDKEISIDD